MPRKKLEPKVVEPIICRLKTIVSGCQCGVEQGALQAAAEFGYETAGFAPGQFMTVDGPRPIFALTHNLVEHPQLMPICAVADNAKMSDGILAMYYYGDKGWKLYRQATEAIKIPKYCHNLVGGEYFLDLYDWLTLNRITKLFITGDIGIGDGRMRTGDNTDYIKWAQQQTYERLIGLFKLIKEENARRVA